ncbi:MAG: amylo-alpha-1,6-glucosidase [Bacteroidales bacterium]|nr:amylo-alpha-1,6-glucosidase [Bacteroidales bacterium]
MAYLEFNKKELVNLEYSLKREFLSTNHAGGYLNTTIAGCNTRKYHGLLVLPLEQFDNEKHILLSSLDETLIQHGKEFNLGIHCYGEVYEPRGHKYITNFEIDKVVAVTYAVGGMVLRKVMILSNREEHLLIRYTLLEAHSPTILRLKPFLAFRNIHSLSKANNNVNRKYREIEKGRSFCLYQGFPELNLQLNTKNDFVSNPDWYYNIEYKEESRRVLESREDLFVPGYFEMPIKKGQTILFSASVKEENPSLLNRKFEKNLSEKNHRDSFSNCLKISAGQFVTKRGEDTLIFAGYPWLDQKLRDTLLALPGLTLSSYGDKKTFLDTIDTIVRKSSDKLIKKSTETDVPLWFFWALQQYLELTGEDKKIWKRYGGLLKEILNSYRDGSRININMHENGLLWGEERGTSLTWMDAYAYGEPITERAGYQIEINSLWYNAICFSMELAAKSRDENFAQDWDYIKVNIEKNFIRAFKIEERDNLADYVGPEGQNKFTRPNQLFTCSFKYSPLDEETKAKVLKSIKKELLTVRGIRTLSPKNQLYKGEYDGDQVTRDLAYHQGTARVWLLSFYIDAMFKLYGATFLSKAQELVEAFEEELSLHCIGSISEVFDGDPPHQPHGCTSYSVSVASLLTSMRLIENYKNSEL